MTLVVTRFLVFLPRDGRASSTFASYVTPEQRHMSAEEIRGAHERAGLFPRGEKSSTWLDFFYHPPPNLVPKASSLCLYVSLEGRVWTGTTPGACLSACELAVSQKLFSRFIGKNRKKLYFYL